MSIIQGHVHGANGIEKGFHWAGWSNFPTKTPEMKQHEKKFIGTNQNVNNYSDSRGKFNGYLFLHVK